jgi:CHAT domain-containing protein
MGEVLDLVPRPAEGRLRLVLVPFGLLSVVPWHAAFMPTGGRRHFAVDDAIISYSPSARMFCDGATHIPTPIRSSLFVGDPSGDLHFAGLEAHAIHRRFYPGGAYFGRAGERAGTPDDVLGWIDSGPEGPSVLHFACHASIDPEHPAEAQLVLGGGALSAEALLHRSRTASLDVEQVFLAACTTSVTAAAHDEVLSLAGSFLAAGARTVVGSLWPVPDAETSLLMFMLHWYLRVEGCDPAEALHRAQLWMLSPLRVIPADLPPELRAYCSPSATFDLAAWAGFTHFGR